MTVARVSGVEADRRSTTYGGCYQWDAIKGADLGSVDGELVLDFNFAYHPS